MSKNRTSISVLKNYTIRQSSVNRELRNGFRPKTGKEKPMPPGGGSRVKKEK